MRKSTCFWRNSTIAKICLTGLIGYYASPGNGAKTVHAEDWRQFRGGEALSINATSKLPATWLNSESETLPPAAWRTPIEGSGWSQPIIVGDRVFVTTAVAQKGGKPKGMAGGVMDPSTMGRAAKPKDPVAWKLICLSLSTGEIQWSETAIEAIPAFGKHASNTYATETPAASDDTVYSFFGAAGLLTAHDFQGKLRWTKTYEPQKINNDFGTGSSLLLADNAQASERRLLVQRYNEESAILACLQADSGEELWRAERPKGSSWSTPILWTNQGVKEVVTGGQGSVIAYDLLTGQERWRVNGLDTSFSCSLVADSSAVYFGTASPGSRAPIYAVGAGHVGDLTLSKDATKSDAILWSGTKSGAGMPSPIVIDNNLYFFGNTATCYDKLTGKELYRKRTPGGTLVAGCPVVAGDRIVLVNEVGDVTLVTPGSEFEFREFKAPRDSNATDAGNEPNDSKGAASGEQSTFVGRDEVFWATPGIANQSLLIRSSDAIYCYR
jgi:outer membrane protein assembly factor BamB